MNRKYLIYDSKFRQVTGAESLKMVFDLLKKDIEETSLKLHKEIKSEEDSKKVIYPLRVLEAKDWKWYAEALEKLSDKKERDAYNKNITEYIIDDRENIKALPENLKNLKGYLNALLDRIDEVRKERYKKEDRDNPLAP